MALSRRQIIIFGLAALVAVAAAVRPALRSGPSPRAIAEDDPAADVVREMRVLFQQVADEIRPSLPSTRDDGTITLVDVQAGPHLGMLYVYRVEKQVEGGEREHFREETPRLVADQACSVGEIRDYMEYGTIYRYRYLNRDGSELLSFDLDEAACARHGQGRAIDIR